MFFIGCLIGCLLHLIYFKLKEKVIVNKLCDGEFEKRWYDCD